MLVAAFGAPDGAEFGFARLGAAQALGFAAGALSPGLLQMVAQVGAMVSFEEGADLLATLAGASAVRPSAAASSAPLGR